MNLPESQRTTTNPLWTTATSTESFHIQNFVASYNLSEELTYTNIPFAGDDPPLELFAHTDMPSRQHQYALYIRS